MNIMQNKTEKNYYAIILHAMRGERRKHSEVSKYQLISQTKLVKLESQCYSKCSKSTRLFSTQQRRRLHHLWTASSIVVAETRESVVGYAMQPSLALGAHQLK